MLNKMKKTLILSSEFPPLPGGIGNHAYHLADQLTRNNYKVSVCTDQRASKFIDDLNFDVKQSFTVHRVKRYSLSILTYLKRIWLGIKLILKTNPDIIIASGKFFLWLGAFLKLLFPKKQFICVLHGSELFAGSKASQTLTSWSLRHFDKRIAVSNFTASYNKLYYYISMTQFVDFTLSFYSYKYPSFSNIFFIPYGKT